MTTQISSASAASIIAMKLKYSSIKNTTTINDMKARDWTPMDDDIEVYLRKFLDKYPTPRKEVDAFIHKILHAPSARKRLPVFSDFCSRQARDWTPMDDDIKGYIWSNRDGLRVLCSGVVAGMRLLEDVVLQDIF
ncbi:hypothetical protein GH714_033933 [Hevea brasiliensis]|uniref:Uncharacterized protein n=1 Tax=Hevea brasiliensis TaxID=3981 RepID=A0A6A6KJZ9_HEVBR|nr:hypothetical protein GH714_033933 [Hevea brasiliensis]